MIGNRVGLGMKIGGDFRLLSIEGAYLAEISGDIRLTAQNKGQIQRFGTNKRKTPLIRKVLEGFPKITGIPPLIFQIEGRPHSILDRKKG